MAAEERCAGDGRDAALAEFETLQAAMRLVRPEGGAVARDIEAARRRCDDPAPTVAVAGR